MESFESIVEIENPFGFWTGVGLFLIRKGCALSLRRLIKTFWGISLTKMNRNACGHGLFPLSYFAPNSGQGGLNLSMVVDQIVISDFNQFFFRPKKSHFHMKIRQKLFMGEFRKFFHKAQGSNFSLLLSEESR